MIESILGKHKTPAEIIKEYSGNITCIECGLKYELIEKRGEICSLTEDGLIVLNVAIVGHVDCLEKIEARRNKKHEQQNIKELKDRKGKAFNDFLESIPFNNSFEAE